MAKYAVVENNVITGLYDDLPKNWKNISNFYLLSGDTEVLDSMGWKTVQQVTPSYNPETQYLGDTYHRIIDESVVETQYVVDKIIEHTSEPVTYTDEQLVEMQVIEHSKAMTELRNIRDGLLSETDFTQLSDVIELNGVDLSLSYKNYRQALRDLPNVYENDLTFVNIGTVTIPVLADFIQAPADIPPETPPEVNTGGV